MVGLVMFVNIKHLTVTLSTSLSVFLATISPSLPGELKPSSLPIIQIDRAKKGQGKSNLGFKKISPNFIF